MKVKTEMSLFLEACYNGDVSAASQHFNSTPLESRNEALFYAAWNGHIEIVQLLLQDPLVQNDAALEKAASKGFACIVRLLLPRVADPNVDLQCVGSEEVLMLFLNEERVPEASVPPELKPQFLRLRREKLRVIERLCSQCQIPLRALLPYVFNN